MPKFEEGEFVKLVQGELNLNEIAQIMEVDRHCNPIWYTVKIEHGQAATFIEVPEICLTKIEDVNLINKITSEGVAVVLDNMLETFKIKNKKYGNSFEKSLDKYGIISALTRISDKWNRLEHLILNNDAGTDDERLQDTLIDLANYCVMTAVYINNKEKEND